MRCSRTILQQGELDGFCLQYAILNAFKAIYPGKFELDQQKKVWSSLIGVTPSLQNFASFGSNIDCVPNDAFDIKIKGLLCCQYSEILTAWLQDGRRNNKSGTRLNIEPVTDSIDHWSLRMLREPFPENAAYIACLKANADGTLEHGPTNEHWIAIVGAIDEKKLAVACSYTSYHLGNKYNESKVDVGTKTRAYNNQIVKKLTGPRVFTGSRYKISIE